MERGATSPMPGQVSSVSAEARARMQVPYGLFLGIYVLLWAGFFLVFRYLGNGWPQRVEAMDFLLLALAAWRLTEILTEEKVARCIRAPFCDVITRQDHTGKEVEEEVPIGRGLRRALGEMVLCPWCAGVWVGTLLTFFYLLAPGAARVVLIAFAVAGGAVLMQILAKLLDRTRASLPDQT